MSTRGQGVGLFKNKELGEVVNLAFTFGAAFVATGEASGGDI